VGSEWKFNKCRDEDSRERLGAYRRNFPRGRPRRSANGANGGGLTGGEGEGEVEAAGINARRYGRARERGEKGEGRNLSR